MAQWVLDLSQAGASFGANDSRVAANSAGGVYVAGKLNATTFTVMAYDADGVSVWQRDFTLPASGVPAHMALAANGSYVAVACRDGSTTDLSYVALLDGADGTITWQQELPFELDSYDNTTLGKKLAVGASGDVYVAGKLTGSTLTHILCKLAAADGTVTWTNNPLDDTSAASYLPINQLELMSNGDAVLGFYDGAGVASVLVFASASGALVWANTISWTNPTDHCFVAVDQSTDDVYAGSWDEGSELTLYVVKMDSTGAEVWNKDVTVTGGENIIAGGAMAADATNVYFGCFITDAYSTYQRTGFIFMPADGSSATAVVTINSDEAYGGPAEGLSVAAGDLYYSGYDQDQVNFYARVIVSKVDPTTFSNSFTPYARSSPALTVSTGASVVASASPTFLADPTVTLGAGVLTDGAGTTVLDTLYPDDSAAPDPLIRFAYSLAPTTQFGTPSWANAHAATSLGPTAQFGTPAVDYDLEPQAIALGPTARFGAAYAVRYGVPNRAAYQIGFSSTAFGTPAAAVAGLFTQPSTDPSTRFGAATARLRQPATTLGPVTTFGTVGAALRQRPSAIHSTAFGTPSAGNVASAAGFLSTRFGTPRAPGAIYGRSYDMDGFLVTHFGTPTARIRQPATTIGAVATFGTPRQISVPHAAGFKATVFGLAQANFTLQATGFVSGDFGTPRAPGAALGRGGLGFGFRNTRLGVPRARVEIDIDADGFIGTLFGTPTLAQGHLARAIRPGSRFGTPAVARTCP